MDDDVDDDDDDNGQTGSFEIQHFFLLHTHQASKQGEHTQTKPTEMNKENTHQSFLLSLKHNTLILCWSNEKKMVK